MLFALLFTQMALVYCQWYVGEEKQTTSIDTENASILVPATSSIECILKCQRKLKNGLFVKEKGQCFCVSEEEHAFPRGVLYEPHMVSHYNLHRFNFDFLEFN